MRSVSLAVVGLCASLALTGCPPSMGEVVTQLSPQLQAKQALLKEVVAALPPAGSVTSPTPVAAPLTPTPSNDTRPGEFSMDILQAEQVEDPDVNLKEAGNIDLLLSRELLTAFKWTAPNSDMRTSGTSSNEHFRESLQRTADLRYVTLVRTVSYTAPVATSPSEFVGGQGKFEVFLVDLADKSIKASFPVEATCATNVNYQYEQGGDPLERLAAFARSTLWEDARKKIVEGLRTHAKATVVDE